MQRHLPYFVFLLLVSPERANAQYDEYEDQRFPFYEMPSGYVGIDFSGASRNVMAFTYQQLLGIGDKNAITGRIGFFGFGSTDGGVFGDGNAQLDLLAGLGFLSGAQVRPHNLELEATYNRHLRWGSEDINRFQNRFTATAGYRLQPFRRGRGFSLRVGAGMMFFQTFDTGSATTNGEPDLDNTAIYPTGYFGLGYTF
jgi:hypothetical protein